MKNILLSILFFFKFLFVVPAQQNDIDSLKQILNNTPRDTNTVNIFLQVASIFYFSKPDTCLAYAKKALNLARELKFTKKEVTALNMAGEALRFLGDYPGALKMQFDALEINRRNKDLSGEARSLGFIGFTYSEFIEYRQALKYLYPAKNLHEKLRDTMALTFDLTNIGNAYDLLKMPDSAMYYQQQAYLKFNSFIHGPLKSLILTRLGNVYAGMYKSDTALQFYRKALANAIVINDKVNLSKILQKIARSFETIQQYDSSLYYARMAFISGQNTAQKLQVLESGNLLVSLYQKTNNYDSVYVYQNIAKAMTDSLYGPQKFKALQLLMLDEQERQQKIVRQQENFKNKIRYIALLSALSIFLLLALILVRNNRQKQKTNNLLNEQKNTLENTLTNLKAAQSQLIQSEKMASLGELTAGIAHEIQNPLNFVNNFSEVNTELIDEARQEINKGNIEEVKTILNNIKDNEQKINHHGKRADAIVKGMLQHSRSSSGTKEPTDINALCDEYLRLSYHGLRAKDKSFNATMKTDFDESIGKINIIPQDIGRVVLNLLTNAFYAVQQKQKEAAEGLPTFQKLATLYEPTVSISTKKDGSKVLISVTDNGNGIPQKVIDKIFQPFFTTKPTGQGTGLGLSLSYDIIKAHGGEIKVETKEGEGTEFIIHLPY